jgi:molecular chaperone DnaK (HSP70)
VTPSRPLGCGIEFGTSNSSVSVAYADRVDVLPIGQSTARTLPSFVYLSAMFGEERLEQRDAFTAVVY